MTQDNNDVTGKRRLRLNPIAMAAALLGAAAFAAALALALVQVGRAPADYYGVLSWLAPEIGLAPLTILLGLAAVTIARAARDVRSTGVGLLGTGLAVASLLIAFTHAPSNWEKLNTRSMMNIRAIAGALIMYEADHGGLPPAQRWTQALGRYVHDPAVWQDPFTGKPGYALNAAIARRRSDSFAADSASVIAVFESDRGANGAGGSELLPRQPRHDGRDIVGFLDGHIRSVRRPQPGEAGDEWLVWNPDTPPATTSRANHPGARR